MTQRRIFLVHLRGAAPLVDEVAHWEQSHAPLFARTPGLLTYVQYRPLPEEWARGVRQVCSETQFADPAAERAAYESDFYRELVTPDEASFLDRDSAWSARIPSDSDGDLELGREDYLVLRFGGPGPGDGWQSLSTSRDAPGGGRELHLLRTPDRSAALRLAAEASVSSFACVPTPVPLRSEVR